jgi:hypothetical protein
MPVRLIIRQLNSFNRFAKRRIFMSMTSGQLVDIPAHLPDTIRSLEEQFLEGLGNTIEDSILFSFISSWEQIGGEFDMTFHQELDKEDWWVHIRDFSTFERIAAVGLAMPESSLKLGLIKKHSSAILVIAFLLASIFIYILATAKRRRTTSKRDSSAERSGSGDWKAIIARGENQSVEFKSALRMDMNLGKVNTALENVIIKSIAAFSNGEGGTLFIGVRDDGSIQGIQEDMATLKKQDSDFFEIHLRNLMKQQFGVTFMTRNIGIEFPEIENREICVIRISRGTEPAYVNMVDKHGNKTERFYVRSGNSSQEIQSLKEINEYISKRF